MEDTKKYYLCSYEYLDYFPQFFILDNESNNSSINNFLIRRDRIEYIGDMKTLETQLEKSKDKLANILLDPVSYNEKNLHCKTNLEVMYEVMQEEGLQDSIIFRRKGKKPIGSIKSKIKRINRRFFYHEDLEKAYRKLRMAQ